MAVQIIDAVIGVRPDAQEIELLRELSGIYGRASLVAFKAKTQRYEHHLGSTSTKKTALEVVSGGAKKILWQVQMKDDVSRFRAEVVAYSVSIGQLLAAATM